MESLRSAFGRAVAFLPDLIAGLVILAVGVLIAYGVQRGLQAILHRLDFDGFLARHRIVGARPTERNVPPTGSRAVGVFAFWTLIVATLMQTARAFRLESVADGLARVLAYVPNLIAGIAIFVVALALGNWVHGQMASGRSPLRHDRIAPGAVRAAIITLGTFMALQELRLANEIVVIAFTLSLGTIAVATALSFGLGGRRAAERVTNDWYDSNGINATVSTPTLDEEEPSLSGDDPDRPMPPTVKPVHH